ncbi:AfsR/SARP family transcriptional regulator [Streptomyces sp. SID13031]|uniref:AfsR/SARP family transcriptional regulator n=1 Tax=Streptomyces sp. SID13031 TaxID=2706046 RepID=UPI0013C95862|nr:AfsR/SARP family transcriptional regulator [Streptomyces sp. SID13031]NEA31171.1 tetratricopeptide repeat protein [Streptomyces sp. SID13031]
MMTSASGSRSETRTSVRLLGQVGVLEAGAEIELGAPGPRSLFAVLALRANATVTLDQLVDALWGEAVPKTAEGGVYTYVSALRKALQPDWTRGHPHRLLTSSRAGYSLLLPTESIDVRRFEEAAAEARRRWSVDDFSQALAHCDLALAQWQGPALGGAIGPLVTAERARLEALELDVQEIRCAALIETSSAADAVSALAVLSAANPLRERLSELLMLGLYRTGRQAEALDVYQSIRRRLIDELGIEPGQALRQMQERVLGGAAEAENLSRRPQPPVVGVVPAQLPHEVAHFTGRDGELRRATELCEAATSDALGGFVLILAIDGPAGVGKTALAVQLARQVAGSFPDGQLFLDLRGFDPRAAALTSGDALEHLLRGLGADPELLQQNATAKAGLYRSLLTGRKVLVVLDNAVDVEQVRPLLPGSRGCLAVVTSRNRLAGLVARDGATRVSVEVLAPDASLDLLRQVLGAELVESDVPLARELAAYCGHLPLALRIAAERIAGSDHYSIGDLVNELRVDGDRLDSLSTPDDESSAVRAVFSWSYRALKPADAQAFRLLGLHPAQEVGVPDAAALLAIDEPAARRQLDSLVRWHLLEQVGRDRYRFHDLLRVYAHECAGLDEPGSSAGAAIERLIGWYLAAAVRTREILAPGLGQISSTAAVQAAVRLTYDEAMTWAGGHLTALIDVLRMAAHRGFDQSAADLATALGALCHSTSRWTEWLGAIEIGQAAARRSGDRLSQGRLANDAGLVHHFLGQQEEAVAGHEAAIEILTDLELDPGQVEAGGDQVIASNLAVAYSMMGRHLEVLPLLEDAMLLARQRGNRFVEASVADSLGAVLSSLGRHDEAIERGLRCVALLRAEGYEHMLGHALTQLGESCLRAGRTDDSVRHLGDALRLWRGLGDQWGERRSLAGLAEAGASR